MGRGSLAPGREQFRVGGGVKTAGRSHRYSVMLGELASVLELLWEVLGFGRSELGRLYKFITPGTKGHTSKTENPSRRRTYALSDFHNSVILCLH